MIDTQRRNVVGYPTANVHLARQKKRDARETSALLTLTSTTIMAERAEMIEWNFYRNPTLERGIWCCDFLIGCSLIGVI